MSFIFQVTSESDAKTAFTVALEKYKGLDVLVNCAGIGVAIATFAPGKKTVHPQAAFEQVLQVILALFCLCRLLVSMVYYRTGMFIGEHCGNIQYDSSSQCVDER